MSLDSLNNYSYNLELANTQKWQFIPTKKTRAWVKKLAVMLELKPADKLNHHAKIIFTLCNYSSKGRPANPISHLEPSLRKGLPQKDWKRLNYRIIRIWSHYETPHLICQIKKNKKEIKSLDILRKRRSLEPINKKVQEEGGFFFHSALAEYNGRGILLAAAGNTGKTTCSKRLPLPWKSLCDDEVLIMTDKDNKYRVHPFPTWGDYSKNQRLKKTWNVQCHLPLSAIFFLEQAQVDEVISMNKANAAMSINAAALQACRRNWRDFSRTDKRMAIKKVFDNACNLAKVVPCFTLRFSLHGQFWKEIEKVL